MVLFPKVLGFHRNIEFNYVFTKKSPSLHHAAFHKVSYVQYRHQWHGQRFHTPLLTLSIISVISEGLSGLTALNLKGDAINEVQEKKSDFL